MNSREQLVEPDAIPAIYMNYEISPITIVYSTKENSFIHFLVQVFESFHFPI